MSDISNYCIVIYDPIYLNHRTGMGHPECMERLIPILNQAQQLGLQIVQPPPHLNNEKILLCHTPDYLSYLEELSLQMQGSQQLVQLKTGDAIIGAESLGTAKRVVSGAIFAVDLVCKGKAKRAFCLSRPPGHHAWADRGKGFCILNSAAIAARYAQKMYAMERILILDWDVHHGDGTQNIFYSDPSVFYFSTHQMDHYPFSGLSNQWGENRQVRNIWNFPIAPTAHSREEVLRCFEEVLPEVASRINPDLIIVSCGFDGHRLDPLGGFNLNDEDFNRLTRAAISVAEKYSKGRLVSILEGGYQLDALASASYEHLKALSKCYSP